jgi:hypothetical protein
MVIFCLMYRSFCSASAWPFLVFLHDGRLTPFMLLRDEAATAEDQVGSPMTESAYVTLRWFQRRILPTRRTRRPTR